MIGNVLSQSGSVQFNNRGDLNPNAAEWLVGQFASAAKSNVFFHLDVGLMEDPTEGKTGTTCWVQSIDTWRMCKS